MAKKKNTKKPKNSKKQKKNRISYCFNDEKIIDPKKIRKKEIKKIGNYRENIHEMEKIIQNHIDRIEGLKTIDFLSDFNRYLTKIKNNFMTKEEFNFMNCRTKINKEIIDNILKNTLFEKSLNTQKITDLYNGANDVKKISKQTVIKYIKSLNYRFIKPTRISSNIRNKQNIEEKLIFLNRFTSILNNQDLVIFTDEMYLGGKILSGKEWVNKSSFLNYSNKKYLGSASLILSITPNKVLYYEFHTTTINSNIFLDYLLNLKNNIQNDREMNTLYNNNKIVILLDNASIHKNKINLKEITKTNLRIIFNCSYEARFNSVEYCFSKIKHSVRSLTYDSLYHRINEAKDEIKKIDYKLCNSYFKKGLKAMIDELKELKEIDFLKK